MTHRFLLSRSPSFGRRTRFAAVAALAALTACSSGGEPGDESLLVFAAVSLRDALLEVAADYQRETSCEVAFNFAGSNVLARQIEAAPQADLFLSADERWMDHLQELGRVDAQTRRRFLSNALVIIGHRRHPLERIAPEDLATLDYRYLSLGDPEAVPAGRYARDFLRSRLLPGTASLWDTVADKVVPAPDVRAALALVESDPEVLGIVYRTDAAISDKVKVLCEVPLEKGPPIHYAAAAVSGRSSARARRFLNYLNGDTAAAIFRRHGFVPPRAAETATPLHSSESDR